MLHWNKRNRTNSGGVDNSHSRISWVQWYWGDVDQYMVFLYHVYTEQKSQSNSLIIIIDFSFCDYISLYCGKNGHCHNYVKFELSNYEILKDWYTLLCAHEKCVRILEVRYYVLFSEYGSLISTVSGIVFLEHIKKHDIWNNNVTLLFIPT